MKTNKIEVSVVAWRKSRRSNASGNCVEVAPLAEGQRLAIRDSKDPSGPVLLVSAAGWRSFTSSLR
ncbi:MAG TPA: DUF397 domain-containing protein [Streptosporangiaceae bacterium]|jgi:hypothetical protein